MPFQLIQADARHLPLADKSVNCVVTSPPYFGLRDYGVEGQIGLEQSPKAYVVEMVEVFREVWRVLKDDGTLFLNIGDSYWSTPGNGRGGGSTLTGKKPHLSGSGRAGPYGNVCKVPASYPARGCLCGSLCDACRLAYQIGKFHSDSPHVPTPIASNLSSSHVRKESSRGRLPTSDSSPQAGHSEGATPDLEQSALPVAELPLASLESKKLESFQQPPGDFPQSAPSSECRLCGCSLQGSVRPFARREACNCDKVDAVSADHKIGRVSSGLAYRDFTKAVIKRKDLIGIPWMVAFALRDAGWYLRQEIIWSKPNVMPESVRDRCTKSREHIFLLSKSERYYFDAKAIEEPAVFAGSARASVVRGGFDGKTNAMPGRESFRAIRETRNKRSVWHVPTQPFKGAHFATYPPKLIEPCILAGCPAGGIVLDPFNGAATTGLVAITNGRDYIGTDINADYLALSHKRLLAAFPLSEFIEGAA